MSTAPGVSTQAAYELRSVTCISETPALEKYAGLGMAFISEVIRAVKTVDLPC